jgi:uncharacterized membrane protein
VTVVSAGRSPTSTAKGDSRHVHTVRFPASPRGVYARCRHRHRVRADPAGADDADRAKAIRGRCGLRRSAAALLVIGLLRVFYFEKGVAYYFSSHAFITKLSVFIVIGIFSAIPTIEFLSWRKALKAGHTPQPTPQKIKMIRSFLHGELIGVAIILLCAAIMARGGWV